MIIPVRDGFSDRRRLPLQRQSSEEVDVFFDQLGRDGLEEIRTASRLLLGVPLLQEIINAMPVPVAVLNDKGQVTCEFRLVRRTPDGPEREDQMVTTTPIQVDGRDFSIFVLHDVDPLVAIERFGL